jgi:tryptophan 2,3-dioxygenase
LLTRNVIQLYLLKRHDVFRGISAETLLDLEKINQVRLFLHLNQSAELTYKNIIHEFTVSLQCIRRNMGVDMDGFNIAHPGFTKCK